MSCTAINGYRSVMATLLQSPVQLQRTTTSRLTALYPGWPGWANTRRNIHSLTPWFVAIIQHL